VTRHYIDSFRAYLPHYPSTQTEPDPNGWKWELAQTRKELLMVKGREKQGHGETAPGKTLLSIVDKSDTHNTREQLANELGWSTGKVAMGGHSG
jgi:hypothetical protein